MEYKINTKVPFSSLMITDLINNKILEPNRSINHTAFLTYHGREFEIHIDFQTNSVDLLKYNGKEYESLDELFSYINSMYKIVKVKKYEHKTINADNTSDLDKSIEKLLNEGFILRGQTKVLNMGHYEISYVQTMTREYFVEREVPNDDR